MQAEAPTPISGEQIIRQLSAFLADRKITSTPALDRNRQFRACGQPLAFTPLFGSFKTVEVRCPDVDGWKIAVRTQIETSLVAHKINRPQVTAKPSLPVQNVLVMRKSVSKGTIITSEDVKIDQSVFPDTVAEPYWTGEKNWISPKNIWTVNFMTGHSHGRFFDYQKLAVRLVQDR